MNKDILKKSFEGVMFIPLGGCGEIGMNLNLYGCNNKLIIVEEVDVLCSRLVT